MNLKLFCFLLMLLVVRKCVGQRDIAFPGAEGFGKHASGGRGGEVIYVTNLNDDGPGSLRQAIRVKEPRIIVFSVSGYIDLKSPLDINYGNVTIAGQTAPGDGICLRNYPLSVKDDNVIIRFMRFRLGDESAQEADAISGNNGVNNVIIDHCSMSWATDECASFYRNSNFTMQWCIIAESLNESIHAKGAHGYGGIWGGKGASFHHNLISSHISRTPRFSGSSTTPNSPDELVDFANNVIYNWRDNNIYGGEAGRYNIRANYFKPGPATRKAKGQIVNPSAPFGKFYIKDNYFAGNKTVTLNNAKGVYVKDGVPSAALVPGPFKVEEIEIEKAEAAYVRVLASAGASLSRDAVDRRIVSEVRNNDSSAGKQKNGIIDSQRDVGGWPPLNEGEALRDTDQDGMPDYWEKDNNLNLRDPADATHHLMDKNFSNVEVYLNQLVEKVVKKI